MMMAHPREVAHEQDSWKYGEDYLVLDGCNFSDIIQDMAKGLDIRTQWKVKEILHGGANSQKVRFLLN
jgi:hypothetical protein